MIAGERLQMFIFARQSCQLSSYGSLTCHTNCGMDLPFSTDHLRSPATLTHVTDHFAVEMSLPDF